MIKNNSTMRLKFLGILLSQLFILALSAQKTDTFQFLTIHDVLENINKHHPITYSSFLQLQYAKANQQKASGNFDPVIQYDFKQKTLDNKKYYQNCKTQVVKRVEDFEANKILDEFKLHLLNHK
jgi:hypothetical protein